MTRRLIEEWLPVAKIGIESFRERTPMTPSPCPDCGDREYNQPSVHCFVLNEISVFSP